MRPLEIAWAELGVNEIAGAEANESILGYAREVGREDITSDEISWCASFHGSCLAKGGVKITVPRSDVLLARAYLKMGVEIKEPRVGCSAILRRGNSSWQGHIGFVTAWTDTHIKLLGGNQANAVNERWYARDKVIGYRWMMPQASPVELAAAGSRTVQKAATMRGDGLGAVVAGSSVQAPPPVDLSGWATQAQSAKGFMVSVADFSQYFWQHWPLVAGGIALYFVARMMWNAGWIEKLRTADHNSGAHTGRVVAVKGVSDDLAI